MCRNRIRLDGQGFLSPEDGLGHLLPVGEFPGTLDNQGSGRGQQPSHGGQGVKGSVKMFQNVQKEYDVETSFGQVRCFHIPHMDRKVQFIPGVAG